MFLIGGWIGLGAPRAQAETLYGLMYDGASGGNFNYLFAEINTTTGHATTQFSFAVPFGLSSLAFDRNTCRFVTLSPSNGMVVEINAFTWTVTAHPVTGLPAAPSTTFIGVEYDPTTYLGGQAPNQHILLTYGQSADSNLQDHITAINPSTGVVFAFTGALAVDDADFLVFNPSTLQLIIADTNDTPFKTISGLFGLNTLATYANPLDNNPMQDPACSANGTMYFSNSNDKKLYRLNAAGNGYTEVGPHGSTAFAVGLAFGSIYCVGGYDVECACGGASGGSPLTNTWTFSFTNPLDQTVYALGLSITGTTIEPNPVPVNGPDGTGGLAPGETATVTVTMCDATASPSVVGIGLLDLNGNSLAALNVTGFNLLGCPACDVQCAPGDTVENEGCGLDSNGGCDDGEAGNYAQIACGATFCGTLWANGGDQDSDWYILTVPDSNDDSGTRVCLTLKSEIPATVQLFEFPADSPKCPRMSLLGQLSSSDCQQEMLCICLPAPGTYKLRVFPDCPPCGEITSGFPCVNNQYRLKAECTETCPCAPTYLLGPGFQAWWPLDEATGTTAEDRQNAANGTWVGGVTPTTGEVAGALHFDGTGHVAVGANSTVPSGNSDLTIDAWIRWEFPYPVPNPTNFHEVIVHQDGYSFFLDHPFNTAPATLGLYLAAINHGCTTSAIIPANKWVHVAATLQQASFGGCKLYVNGQLVSQSTPLALNSLGSDGSLLIGRDFQFFNGDIDEVEMFDRALSPEQINTIYLAGSAGKCKYIVPAVSEWGLVIISLLLVTVATIITKQRRAAVLN